MGRAWLVLCVVALAACHHAAAVGVEEPEPARAPLPPYGGAVWTGPCTVVREPASASERAARLAAMQTWLPAGARIELSALGDRARRIWIPGDAKHRHGRHRMRRLVAAAAPLFGGRATEARTYESLDVVETPRGWLAEVSIDVPEVGEEPVLVMIDRATGDARLGLVGEILPREPLCNVDRPDIDEMAFVDAVVGRSIPVRRGDDPGPPITRFDVVVEKRLRAETSERTTRAVVDVIVGPNAATAPDERTIVDRARAVFVVDAVTHEVVATHGAPGGNWCGTRPPRDVAYDAKQLFPD